jgi:DNA-binding GntR family transcriptional regulator
VSSDQAVGTEAAAFGDEPIAVLNRGNLKDQIAQVLRTEILAGRMHPGTTNKMGELAARFGASRTPMREAILELEAKGLVEITRGVGFRVIAASPRELRDNLQIREMLEAPAMASIAGRLTPDELGRARDLVQEIHDAAVDNDLTRYLDRDRQFHLFLMERTGNRRLVKIVGELRDVQRMPGLAQMASDGNLIHRNDDHVGMLDAIEAGDSDGVAALVRRHLELSRLAWAHDEPPVAQD